MSQTATATSTPDYGSAFLHTHYAVELEGDTTGRGHDTHHAVVRDGHILDKLFRHGTIEQTEWAAGMHLAELAQRGGFVRYASIALGSPRSGQVGPSGGEGAIGSREAFRRAIEALPGPMRQTVTMIVIESRPIVEWERAALFRPGSGLGALRLTLQTLAVHFGLMSPKRYDA